MHILGVFYTGSSFWLPVCVQTVSSVTIRSVCQKELLLSIYLVRFFLVVLTQITVKQQLNMLSTNMNFSLPFTNPIDGTILSNKNGIPSLFASLFSLSSRLFTLFPFLFAYIPNVYCLCLFNPLLPYEKPNPPIPGKHYIIDIYKNPNIGKLSSFFIVKSVQLLTRTLFCASTKIMLYFEYYHTVVTSTPNLYKILSTSQNPFMIYILLYKNYPDILINYKEHIYMIYIYIYRDNSADTTITKQYRSIINFIYDIIHITNYMDTEIYIKRKKALDNLVDDHISDEVYIRMLQRWQRDIYILANICHKDSASIQMIIEIYFSLLTPSFSNPYIIQQLFTSTLLDAFYILTPFYKPEVMHKLFLEKKININGINMNSINTNATTNNNMPIVSSINNTNNNTTLNNNIIANKLLGHSYPSSIRISTPSTHIGTSIYIPPSLSATPPSSIPLSLSNLQYNSQHHLMKQDSNSSYHENNDCVSSPIVDIDTTTNNNIHSFSHHLSGSNRNSLDPLEYDSEIPFPKASITPMPSSTSVSPYEVNNTNEIVFDGDRNEIYTTTTQGNSSSFSEIRPINMDTIYKEADNDIEISPYRKRINSISNGELFENDNNYTNNNTNDNNDKNTIPQNVNSPLSAHLSSTIANQIKSTLQSSDLNTCIDYTYDIHNNCASNILLTPTNKDRIAISHHNNIITLGKNNNNNINNNNNNKLNISSSALPPLPPPRSGGRMRVASRDFGFNFEPNKKDTFLTPSHPYLLPRVPLILSSYSFLNIYT
ncbi:hypothetical protein WA158_003922 [Blastocystis sp. Blastoise]